MNTASANKGFTLIELMIVIAIIGILASIALPTYLEYVGRAQATEALKVTEPLKTDIGFYYWDRRSWPTASDAVISASGKIKGKYFDMGDVVITPNTGVITVTFKRGANTGKNVVLTPSAHPGNGQIITWKCSGSVGVTRLPATCQ